MAWASAEARQVAGGAGEQVVSVGLGVVLSEAFLVALANHKASVGALAEVNFAAAIAQRRRVDHGHVVE